MSHIDVDKLINELTLEQKVALLTGKDNWHTVGIPEKEIPSLRFSDGPNGIRGTKFFNGVPSASFPCGTAMGATFDHTLLEEAGKLMGEEAKAKGAHVVLGPTVNIQRSPLGGRGFESFSEDPLLSGESAASVIRGMQGEGIQATLKHFVCNDQEDDRRGYNAIVSERALREIYLMPFQLALRDSNPGCFMSSYNLVNGVHVAEDPYLLQQVLRDEWKYDGLVMSDWFGTYSTIDGIKAGNNLEMPGGMSTWRNQNLVKSVLSRDVNVGEIDKNARRVLNLIKRSMEQSHVPENAPEGGNDTPETSAFLRKLAAESVVLLKNKGNILPLKKNVTTAVIGPNADFAALSGGGSASLKPYYAVTPLEGISKKVSTKYQLGSSSAVYSPLIGRYLKTADGKEGFTFRCYDKHVSDSSRKLADTFNTSDAEMFMMDYYPEGLDITKAYYVDIEGYLTPDEDAEYEFGCSVFGTAKVYVDGKLVVDNETVQRPGSMFFGVGTVEETGSVHLKAGQTYKYTVNYGSSSTSKLEMSSALTFGGGLRLGMRKLVDEEEELKRATALAKSVEQVVLCIGLSGEYESEGFDREHMDLPKGTEKLVERVIEANPNTVVVLQCGTPVALPFVDKVSGIVQAWYGGNETGNAIADVLFGDVNPSGKLPLSWPKRLEDNPAFLNFGSDKGATLYGENIFVGYRYYEKTKKDLLFPFGYGLSYTNFEYGKLSVKVENEKIIGSIDITNTGKVNGKEVVQFYVVHESPSTVRPLKELKGFTKVEVDAGKTTTAKIEIPLKYAVSYWDSFENKWIQEKGNYLLLAASSSTDVHDQAGFQIDATKYWTGI